MNYSHKCFGSRLDITVSYHGDFTKDIQECFDIADAFEAKYSRFIEGNFLSALNTKKTAVVDSEFRSLIKLALQISEITKGYFDITLLPLLENKGYGISTEKLPENIGYKNIILGENDIQLKNNISLDIGALGKGYMVDKIFNILSPKIESFVINFGGDIRIKGIQTIELEDPLDDAKSLGNIEVKNMSIASSAGNKRKFNGGHHLLNPRTGHSQNDKIALYVTHKLASFADIFSTALFVAPLEVSLEVLKKTKGLEAMIIAQDGKIYKSAGFNCNLNIK